jgi:hypothetical protein
VRLIQNDQLITKDLDPHDDISEEKEARMRVDGGMSPRGNGFCTAGTPKSTRAKDRVTRKTSWINGLLDLAIEVVTEARAASSSHGREPEELTAFKGRMKDRRIREHAPSGT